MQRATIDFPSRHAARALVLQNRMASSGHWVVFAVVMVLGSSAALLLYHLDKNSLVYFGDSTSHLIQARKLADWGEDPGLARFGTVWLPVPHLLLLPFTLASSLFSSGFAGVAVSLPSVALTAVLLYKIIKNHLAGPAFLAGAGALLYALNPNILYLGLTPMTEAPFMLFFVGSAYFLQKWYRQPDDMRSLLWSSMFVVLATLCRYEGWILPLFFVPLVVLSMARADVPARRQAAGLALGLASLAGVLLWLGHNAYQYGDPLEFANSEYYSAASQAQSRDIRETLFLQPANVLSVYGVTAFTVYGPILLSAAVIGVVQVVRGRPRGGTDIRLLVLFLALPPLFTMASLVVGIGEMTFWFNSRYLVLLSPVLIVLAVRCVQGLGRGAGGGRAVVTVALAASLVLHAFMIVIDWVPMHLDARNGFTYHVNPFAVQTGEALSSAYDGGKIMIMTGSAQEHRIMLTAGIPLGQYDEIVESSTWKVSYDEPWRYDRWLVMSRAPDADGVSTIDYWNARRSELDERYNVAYENQYYEILLRKDT